MCPGRSKAWHFQAPWAAKLYPFGCRSTSSWVVVLEVLRRPKGWGPARTLNPDQNHQTLQL